MQKFVYYYFSAECININSQPLSVYIKFDIFLVKFYKKITNQKNPANYYVQIEAAYLDRVFEED